MSFAPIVLFAYNRPDHTRRAIESLRRCTSAIKSRLVIYCDGPRNDKEARTVSEVRAIAKTVKGFAEVEVIEREINVGLADSVIEGVTQVCSVFGRVIVVEDDLVLAPGFLSYMNAALDRYKNEPLVMQVSGHMFPVKVRVGSDAFFLPFVSSWGWATWARAWVTFDAEAKDYSKLESDAALRHVFNMNGGYDYFSMLKAQREGKVDSWAIRWNLSVFMNNGLVLYPKKTMVENAGFDGTGTHTRGDAPNQLIDSTFLPERLPEVGVDSLARDLIFDYFRARRTLTSRVLSRVRRLFQ